MAARKGCWDINKWPEVIQAVPRSAAPDDRGEAVVRLLEARDLRLRGLVEAVETSAGLRRKEGSMSAGSANRNASVERDAVATQLLGRVALPFSTA